MSSSPRKMPTFSEPARQWFLDNFADPTPVQQRGWEQIAGGAHSLLVAPTGSGKTLAAFLSAIDRVAQTKSSGVQILYISPLKALVVDVERNLRAPLAGILRTAEKLGESYRPLSVDVRTGDTPSAERRRQSKSPGDILVTTPESLFLILGSQARAGLTSVTTVIIDEIHSLAPTKRGAHLALSLERLSELTDTEPQRIGLSATAHPLEDVGRFLAGNRPFEIVDAHEKPKLELQIHVPIPDMDHPPAPVPLARPTDENDANLAGNGNAGPGGADEPAGSGHTQDGEFGSGGSILGQLHQYHSGEDSQERGIWPVLYPEIVEAIRSHRSTIVFVNSRGLCERLTRRINELAGEELAQSHHGSVSHARRTEIEDALKRGELQAIVATSSLELGIDMGAVDLVLLLESPGSVARGLQRVGRAGHHVGQPSRGRIFPKFKGDLLECTAIAEGMIAGKIEAIAVPDNPLDVLAQQIVAICVDQTRTTDELAKIVRRAHSFRALPEDALRATLDMLTGHFPSTDFADLRPRLSWDRSTDQLSARRGSAMVTRTNAGTIPDRGAFGVYIAGGGPRVGELDEEMVHESRAGETVVLGASTWRIEEITRDRVVVVPAPGESGRLPFWKGERLGRPLELGRAMGTILREVGPLEAAEAKEELQRRAPLSEFAAQNLVSYLSNQKEHAGELPHDRSIVVERFRDELGDWRVCILSPFGNRVHAPWALAIEELLGDRSGFDVQVLYHDDGIALRFADTEDIPPIDELLPDPEELEDLVTRRVGSSSLFASLFRENAVRSLLITRRRPGQRTPLWAQRLKAKGLLATAERFPDFPIVLETYRQALSDVFDLPALQEILTQIRARKIAVREIETASPSPFARSLAFAYVASYLYNEDAPVAERRAQALTLDRGLLRELLGQAELRELLDENAIASVEAEIQALASDRKARDHDELHDLLRRLGDLSEDELRARTEIPANSAGSGGTGSTEGATENSAGHKETLEGWLETLRRERRATLLRIGGEERWIRAEEASIYRDALGSVPESGLPAEFLESGRGLAVGETPLDLLVRRFARTHGPFHLSDVAARFALREEQVEPILRSLESGHEVLSGEIRPGGSGTDWCHVEVLRRIKRQTLAILRGQIAAVDPSALARFLPSWQGVTVARDRARAPVTLLDVLEQLEGLVLPWSAWIGDVLPARVPGFASADLDALSASGQIVWIGAGALGTRDGRVAILRRDSAAALWDSNKDQDFELDAIHQSLLSHLTEQGASFQHELESVAQTKHPDATEAEVHRALWDLAWQGYITNDTFQPLNGYASRRVKGSRQGMASSALRGASPRGGTQRQQVPERSGRPSRSRYRPRAERPRLGRVQVSTGGRWWRTEQLLADRPSETECAFYRAESLLARYGIVSREVAKSEKWIGGFGPLYRVLSEMEEGGHVRRGWFVDGLSGGQFALAGALDRLRQMESEKRTQSDTEPLTDGAETPEGTVLILSAVDPANPFGALLPWPNPSKQDPDIETVPFARRTSGAYVVTVGGHLRLYVPKNRKELWTFGREDDATAVRTALSHLRDLPKSKSGRSVLQIEKIDGEPASSSPLASWLEDAGFVRGYRAFSLT